MNRGLFSVATAAEAHGKRCHTNQTLISKRKQQIPVVSFICLFLCGGTLSLTLTGPPELNMTDQHCVWMFPLHVLSSLIRGLFTSLYSRRSEHQVCTFLTAGSSHKNNVMQARCSLDYTCSYCILSLLLYNVATNVDYRIRTLRFVPSCFKDIITR